MQKQQATLEKAFLVSQNCFIIIIIIIVIIIVIIIIIIIIFIIIIILSCVFITCMPQGKNGLRAGKRFRLTLYKLQPKGSPLV